MSNTKKMTKAEMYAQILSHTTDETERAFLEHEMELIAKKNASKSDKLTPVQKENEATKEAIYAYMAEAKKPMTISMMIKEIPACGGFTSQKVSQLARQMILAQVLRREEVKGVAWFSIT